MRKKKEGWREDTVESVSNRRDSGNICDPLTLSRLRSVSYGHPKAAGTMAYILAVTHRL